MTLLQEAKGISGPGPRSQAKRALPFAIMSSHTQSARWRSFADSACHRRLRSKTCGSDQCSDAIGDRHRRSSAQYESDHGRHEPGSAKAGTDCAGER
jgi:hypothetical protein